MTDTGKGSRKKAGGVQDGEKEAEKVKLSAGRRITSEVASNNLWFSSATKCSGTLFGCEAARTLGRNQFGETAQVQIASG
jgi:hypothetical protein